MSKGWNKTAVVSTGLLAAFLCKGLLAGQEVGGKPSKEEVIQKAQTVQVPFIVNNGQVDECVGFYAKTFGGTVFVTKSGEIVYALPNGKQINRGADEHRSAATIVRAELGQSGENQGALPGNSQPQSPIMGVAIKEHLVGGKIDGIKGGATSETTVSYFKGNDPAKWKSNIPTHELVDMGEVYDGIGLRLKAYGNNVEKLFTVMPDANPEAINIEVCGAKALSVSKEGELVAETELGPVKFTKPLAYQEIDGERVYVEVAYKIQDVSDGGANALNNEQDAEMAGGKAARERSKLCYGFTVAAYNPAKDLIIDPLQASTFLGGGSSDFGVDIALDSNRNVYVTGNTSSSNFPTTGRVYDTSYGGGSSDVFISKLNNMLTNLRASTFLGHESADEGTSLAFGDDGSGNILVYVTGRTNSLLFPTTSGAYNISHNGLYDAFISRLNSSLSTLQASTFLGGSEREWSQSIAINSNGGIFVTGYTNSSDFPTVSGSYGAAYNGDPHDAFVSKLDSDLSN